MSYLFWEDLTDEEKEQATQTYRVIRAQEEERDENNVDPSGVENCKFERKADGYIEVII